MRTEAPTSLTLRGANLLASAVTLTRRNGDSKFWVTPERQTEPKSPIPPSLKPPSPPPEYHPRNGPSPPPRAHRTVVDEQIESPPYCPIRVARLFVLCVCWRSWRETSSPPAPVPSPRAKRRVSPTHSITTQSWSNSLRLSLRLSASALSTIPASRQCSTPAEPPYRNPARANLKNASAVADSTGPLHAETRVRSPFKGRYTTPLQRNRCTHPGASDIPIPASTSEITSATA